MCGITAIVTLDAKRHPEPAHSAGNGVHTNGDVGKPAEKRKDALEKDLYASLEKIVHRGPDAQGVWTSPEGHVGLGHCRLAINDLSPDGCQPFHSPDQKIHAVVNGELYDHDRIRAGLEKDFNYHFNSRSDCEIVIALYKHYGVSFLNQLRGEFALCLYDETRHLFIAARDRYGIKPLFWTVSEGRLLLGAEAKAFLPLGWTPRWDVRSLVDGGWGQDTRTVFRRVQKLRPGYYLTCTPFGGIESRQYWDVEYPDKNKVETRTEQQMVEGVRNRMLEAVRLRLRADVPVGIYLSGGIDSSVIAGMASHLVQKQGEQMGSQDAKKRICCFSIAFDEESGFDESDISNRTAKWLDVKFMKKQMDEEQLAKRIEDATYHCEHQNADLNYVGKFALSEIVREAGYKVVLTGEGADENFGGYPLYQPDFLSEPDPAWPSSILSEPSDLLTSLRTQKEAQVAATYTAIGADASNRVPNLASRQLNGITTMASMQAFNPPLSLFSTWTQDLFGQLDPRDTIANNIDNRTKSLIQQKWHPLNSAQYVWTKGHLANNFLSCLGDRTEMAHSIEARTPFLDHHLTEYANSLPPSMKIKFVVPDAEAQSTTGAATNGVHKNGNASNGERNAKRSRTSISENQVKNAKFVEKYILREAAKPFITDELYKRTKHPYSAATFYPADGPIHAVFKRLVTEANVEALGFVEWSAAATLLGQAFSNDVGEDVRSKSMRLVLIVTQWIVLSQRFGIEKAESGGYEMS